jgi:hypothetical protein
MDSTLAKVAENIKQAKLKGVQTKCKSNAIINDIIKDNDDAVLRKIPSHSAFKQVITREIKKNKVDNFKGPIDLKELIVPEHLKKTYRGKLFLLEDSNDEERVLLFSTEQNMKLLSSNSDCFGDGTFKILPLSFYQLFSVLVMINNYISPLAFGLLPNKKQKIYVKFFSLNKKHLNAYPNSINVDFEREVFNAVSKVFGNDFEIYGCYFHLSQNFSNMSRIWDIMFYTKLIFVSNIVIY